MTQLEQEIYNIFMDTLEPEEPFTYSSDMTLKELNVDSLDLLEVVTAIELKYDIEIDDDSLKAIQTLGDAVGCVDNLIHSK